MKQLTNYKMPIRISSNAVFTKYLGLLLIVFVTYIFIQEIINKGVSVVNSLLFITFILFLGYFIKLIHSLANLKIDSEHFYLTFNNRRKQYKFQDIKSIKMLDERIDRRNIWKLEFYESGNLRSVKFWQRGWSLKYINLLQEVALKNNKKISIKNYTYSFDNDI